MEVPAFLYRLSYENWKQNPNDTSLIEIIVGCEIVNAIEDTIALPEVA